MAEAATAYHTHADKLFSYIYMFSKQVFLNIYKDYRAASLFH